MELSTFWENMLANAVLGVAYLGYKILDRCLHSRCKYTAEKGFDFDMDGAGEPCPANDLSKIGDLLKQRSQLYKPRGPPPLPSFGSRNNIEVT